jgi:peptidoglycan/xylan/chitin deacetylase (PgdA/CDA1 family)
VFLELGYAGLLSAAAVMAYAVRAPQSTILAPSVHQGPSKRKAIALTFDDGPSVSTPELLDLLDQHQARATFFQIGKHVERLPHIAKMVIERGHEIGNHSYSHSALYLRHVQFICDELYLAQRAIHEATGTVPQYFRAPYGCRWFGLRFAQQQLNLQGVMWTEIARDWKSDAKRVHRQLKSAARKGAILCLHDGRELHPKPDIRNTIEAVRLLLPELRQQGYDLVTVSELLCPIPPSNASSE